MQAGSHHAETDFAAPLTQAQPVAVNGATFFDMRSTHTSRVYRIFVAVPFQAPPPGGYPLVVVTDANMSFAIAATHNAAFGLGGGRTALVVGIGYPTDDFAEPFRLRVRDLTPSSPSSKPGQPSLDLDDYGGAEPFFRFLVEELRPAISAAHPVDRNDQTLFGHSLAGLFTLHVLMRNPGAFRNFVASSPAIWWNDRALLREEAGFAARIRAKQAAPRILILVGARESNVPDVPHEGTSLAETRDMMKDVRMVENARDLSYRLAELEGAAAYEARFHAFQDEDHLTVLPAAIGRALTFALRPTRPK